MKKNIEWLKEEITEILLTSKKDGTNYFYYRDLKEKIYNAIDQLDEAEVLSQEWIGEHEKREQYTGPFGNEYIQYVVPSRYLKNLLVQEPEPELPEVPQFVADAIEESNHMYVVGFLDTVNKENEELKKVWEWAESKHGAKWNLLARAWLDGYTVEEEHTTMSKYVVQTNTGTYLMLDTSKREWDYTPLPPHDDDAWFAHKFDDRDVAEGIAKIINGTVVELKEQKPTINASDPFGASPIGDLIDR